MTSTQTLRSVVLLLARVLLAFMFIQAGYSKIEGFAGAQGYMNAMGVPSALLPLVILLELGGGLAILLGFLTRFNAVALALFCVAAAFLFHNKPDDMVQGLMFAKNLTIAGGFLALAGAGAGSFSLDALLCRMRGRSCKQTLAVN